MRFRGRRWDMVGMGRLWRGFEVGRWDGRCGLGALIMCSDTAWWFDVGFYFLNIYFLCRWLADGVRREHYDGSAVYIPQFPATIWSAEQRLHGKIY